MTLGEFSVIFGKLALQLRATDVDEPMIRSYFEPLSDLPLESVRMAQEAFSRESGRKWFPTTAEWRERAQMADTEALRKALPPARTEPWKDECKDCSDTGFIHALTCDGGAELWPEQREKQPRGNQKWKPNRTPVGFRVVERGTARPQAATCGNHKPHDPHVYTMICPCRATNHTYQRSYRLGKA